MPLEIILMPLDIKSNPLGYVFFPNSVHSGMPLYHSKKDSNILFKFKHLFLNI